MKTVSASASSLSLSLVLLLGTAAGDGRAESLWTSGKSRETAMFGDRNARRVGDILTVVVQESASVQASRRTRTDKSSSVDSGIESFLYAPPASGTLTHNGAMPTLRLGGSNEFNGGGEINNRQSISARAAVTVVDVLPNGNLVIEGSRYVAYSGEKQYAVLRGIVRPDDIGTGNVVLSSSIADARVEFLSQGSISVTQRKGVFTRVFDLLNPF